jgi:hypothetical protein
MAEQATGNSCRLDAQGLTLQLDRYLALAPHVVRLEREDGTLRAELAADADERLLSEALAVERECCSFLAIEHDPAAGTLTISAPRGGAEAVDAIAAALSGAR